MKHASRLCTAAIGAAIAIIAVVAPMVGAGASPISACSATSGVTVIVDFTHFAGGNIERGCAAGHPSDALVALSAAGFTPQGTNEYPTAFLCRIDGLPTTKQEQCIDTPSATAYWAFWLAKPTDKSWTYSNAGVTEYQPAPGTIEAFAFGDEAQPGISPSAAIPTPPPTQPTTATTSPPVTAPPTVSAASVPTTPRTTGKPLTTKQPTTTKPPAKHPTPTSTRVTRPPTTSPPTTPAGPRIIDRSASGPVAHESSGSPLPTILTIVVVAALAAGAFVLTRARRLKRA